jgi:hypothetical protein
MGSFLRKVRKAVKLTKTVEILPEDEVRLHSAFGVPAKVYIPALFALAFAVVLFLVFFLPGIMRPGSLAVFRSEPLGAAVYVDGVYAGQTPCNVLVRQGEREFMLTMAGFHDGTVRKMIKSRMFGSLFFPRRDEVRIVLEEDSPNAALLAGAREFAAWSFTLEPTETYQIPLVLSEGAYRSGAFANSEAARNHAKELLKGAARFTQSRAGLKDLIRALALMGNGGNAPSPLSLVSSAQDALFFLQDNPESAAWLADILPSGLREKVAQSGWYAVEGNADSGEFSGVPFQGPIRQLVVEDVTFIQVSDNLQSASTQVTSDQFARFIDENPEWRAENAETLAARGLATVDYLVGAEDTRYPAPTVSGVSWYAAEAYCSWLTSRLPASLAGWMAVLPSEAQWEEAVFADGVEEAGTIWEWCADPYAPFSSFRADAAVIAAIAAPEKSVRGASWAKPLREREQYIRETRGSAPPESSTPFVSFRPVLVREN